MKVSFCRVFLLSSLLLSGWHENQRQITLDLFQNCDVPEEVSVSFDPEIDLSDDAVGRSCYEQFYSVCSNYVR